MKKLLLKTLFLFTAATMSIAASANSTTALYRVERVQLVLKLVELTCKDTEEERCARTKHWRVYYQALSSLAMVKTHQVLLDMNPPQIGSVTQLTIDYPAKKKAG
ncbi:MAG: hypothetical protein HRU25_07290 [Psychrobium sp.]|nr:hypothetical protein [Psychrobium sp.]